MHLHKPPEAPPIDVPVQPIVVKVTEHGNIEIQNRVVQSRSIRPTIVRLLAEQPESSVVVKIEPKAKTKLVVEAVDGVRGAKVMMPAISLIET